MLFFVQNGWLHCNLEWRDSFSTSRALRNMFQSRLTQETTHTLCLYSHSVNTISSVAATCCIFSCRYLLHWSLWATAMTSHSHTHLCSRYVTAQVTAVFSWTIGVQYQRWYRRRGGQTRIKEIAEFLGGFFNILSTKSFQAVATTPISSLSFCTFISLKC